MMTIDRTHDRGSDWSRRVLTCMNCGYDLSGIAHPAHSVICPECGTEQHATEPPLYEFPASWHGWWILLRRTMACWGVALVFIAASPLWSGMVLLALACEAAAVWL